MAAPLLKARSPYRWHRLIRHLGRPRPLRSGRRRRRFHLIGIRRLASLDALALLQTSPALLLLALFFRCGQIQWPAQPAPLHQRGESENKKQ
jgi:hypothetical protein